MNTVDLAFKDNEIYVKIETLSGAIEDIVPCTFYKEWGASFNLVLLAEALEQFEMEEVTLQLRTKNDPLVLKGMNLIQVLMPIKK
jgi:DNA polymerase III sliding clamp (beta) subunit (PCNA family)